MGFEMVPFCCLFITFLTGVAASKPSIRNPRSILKIAYGKTTADVTMIIMGVLCVAFGVFSYRRAKTVPLSVLSCGLGLFLLLIGLFRLD